MPSIKSKVNSSLKENNLTKDVPVYRFKERLLRKKVFLIQNQQTTDVIFRFDTETLNIVKSVENVRFSNKRWIVPNGKMDELKEKFLDRKISYHEDIYDKRIHNYNSSDEKMNLVDTGIVAHEKREITVHDKITHLMVDIPMPKIVYAVLKSSDLVYEWAKRPESAWIISNQNKEQLYSICKTNDIKVISTTYEKHVDTNSDEDLSDE